LVAGAGAMANRKRPERRFGAHEGWPLRPFGGAFWTAGPGDLWQSEMAAASSRGGR
jgi:hypothetical protein